MKLAEIRSRHGVSGRALAPQVGVQQSAISKIERGVMIPSRDYLERFAQAVGLTQAERDEIFAVAESLSQRIHRVQLGHAGEFTRVQRLVSALEYTELRMFQASLIPGPLQTPAYARAIFRAAQGRRGARGLTTDLESALDQRRNQAGRLYDPTRSFSFLIHESALYARTCSTRNMTAQLQHLVDVAQRPNVQVGLVPLALDYHGLRLEPPQNSFDLYDRKLVALDLYRGWLNLWDEAVIAEYAGYFARLESVAVFGAAFAREVERLVRRSP